MSNELHNGRYIESHDQAALSCHHLLKEPETGVALPFSSYILAIENCFGKSDKANSQHIMMRMRSMTIIRPFHGVLEFSAAEGQPSQVRQVVHANGRTETLMAKELDGRPVEVAHVAFQHVIPVLCCAGHMEGGQLHLVSLPGALSHPRGSSPPSNVGKDSLWKRGTPMPSSAAAGEACRVAGPSKISGSGNGECENAI